MWRYTGAYRVGAGAAKSLRAPVPAALALALALVAIALVVTLSRSPLVLARTNGIVAEEPLVLAPSGFQACQSGELVPAHTTAIRLTLVAAVGPRVALTLTAGPRLLTSGATPSGWTSGNVTIPVKPLPHAVPSARLCFELGRSAEDVTVGGAQAGRSPAAQIIGGGKMRGRFTVEYMRPAGGSWFSRALTVARRMGLGHAPSGAWLAPLLLFTMGATLATASWLLVRELR
jgi:hypothetical protein